MFKLSDHHHKSGSLLPRYSGGEGLGMRGLFGQQNNAAKTLNHSTLAVRSLDDFGYTMLNFVAPHPQPLSPSTGRGERATYNARKVEVSRAIGRMPLRIRNKRRAEHSFPIVLSRPNN